MLQQYVYGIIFLVNAAVAIPTPNHDQGPIGGINYPFKVPGLEYGPEFGVKHTEIGGHPKNYDDTPYLPLPPVGNKPRHREMTDINCYTEKQYFIGLDEIYRGPGGTYPVSTAYHGWSPSAAWLAKGHHIGLAAGARWKAITVRACGRKLTGIRIQTTARTNNNLECCAWNHDVDPKSSTCTGATLVAPPGRRIVGLYGDWNGIWFTRAQGVRGIGLITMKD